MRIRTALVMAASAASAFALMPSAEATHSWGGYHWARTSNPFTLILGDNVDNSWDSYLGNTSADWSTSTVLDTVIRTGSTTGRKCRPSAGTVQVCNAAYGNNGWLGLAQIWLSGKHITQGTTKMNDSYFRSSFYDNPNEREHVMCQEVGHTFGLDHQSTDGSSLNTCMDYFSNTGANSGSTLSTTPNQHDYDELVTIYSHTDSTSTVKAGTATASAGPADDRASWGQEVQRSARESVFVRDLGHGQRLVTFVTWAA